jgi:hypothetical protein
LCGRSAEANEGSDGCVVWPRRRGESCLRAGRGYNRLCRGSRTGFAMEVFPMQRLIGPVALTSLMVLPALATAQGVVVAA